MTARPTLRIGVTGHRLNRLAAARCDAVRDALAGLFDVLGRGAEAGRLELLSPLAEGSDRLAAEAMPPGWRLTVLLPMAAAEYERDFLKPGETESASLAAFRALCASAVSVTALPPIAGADPRSRAGRDLSYAALGARLVREVDLLVAVWNGRPAEGPGGTAGVVEEAVDLGVPVLRIDPDLPAAPPTRVSFDGRRPSFEPADPTALAASLKA